MAKKRVHEIAKETGLPPKEVLEKLQGAGLSVKAAASAVEEREAKRILGVNGGAAPTPRRRTPAPDPVVPGRGGDARAPQGGGRGAPQGRDGRGQRSGPPGQRGGPPPRSGGPPQRSGGPPGQRGGPQRGGP